MSLTPILLRIVGAFAIAVAGGALSALFARTHKQLCAFISLGAGSLLGVAVCGIGPEVLGKLHWWQFLLGAGSGYLLFAVVGRYIFHVCPACAARHFDEATTHRLAAFGLAMMPGEIFVELGLAIKQASPFKTTLVVELANSVETMYVPTRVAAVGGGYEAINSALEPGSGEMLAEAGVRLLREIASDSSQVKKEK